ncbi:2Fe-2S iron-sulfur cluster-binding protein [Methylobacterium indicum]|uniref:Ferredoxin n=1 Tax=Methylobacterium indicum TaxID=1775910 RepID=A0A8H8X0A7_9HYPH|nr:2Fe-2S iron-sulfur cluster-binding protein [Methylobacterium indicum]BCM87689.1 hypothetical protein mvi_61500 [Methylobacterium indicum]
MTDTAPFISRILIFPIKSLDGAEVSRAHVLASGALADDRRWALFDDRGRVVSGKTHAAIHVIRSRYDLDARSVTLHVGGRVGLPETTFALDGDPGPMEAWLSDALGFTVHLRADHATGYPDDTHSPGPTVISVATIAEIGRWFGLRIEQVRARLRTNVEVGGVPAFWEDRLFGEAGEAVAFRLGAVEFLGINPCQRCVVPARNPDTGRPDSDFALRFAELRRRTRPAWSDPTRFNHFFRVAVNTRLGSLRGADSFAVGDAVTSRDAAIETVVAESPCDFWAGTLTIDGVRDEAPGVKTFRMRAPDGGALPFRFRAGQFVLIAVTHGDARHQRAYSLSSSPASTDHCEVTVKREGTVSGLLHEQFGPGERIEVSGPFGEFGFDDRDADAILLIGGGIGMTPLISKLRFFADAGWPGRVDLVQVARRREDLIFAEAVAALGARLPGLRVHVTLTAPGDTWEGSRGRLSASWLQDRVGDVMERHVLLCGPVAMTAAARATLQSLGVPDVRIEIEAFGRPPAPDLTDAGEREVRFSHSAVSITVTGSDTLLDAAIAGGIPLDSGCLAGVCGRCKVRLVGGEVAGGCEVGLSAADRADGYVLACQTRPLGPIVVDC